MVDIAQASDADIRENVDIFTAAMKAKRPVLPQRRLETILLAVDESNQGELAERFAASLAKSHGSRVVLLYAYEGVRVEAREAYLTARAQALERTGVTLEPLEQPVRTEHGERSFEQILSTCERKRCQLVIAPAPYLDDYTKLGEESIGTNLDVLLSRSPVPVLVVRSPEVHAQRCLESAVLAIAPYEQTTVDAAAWSLALVRSGGEIVLLAAFEDRESAAAKEAGEAVGRPAELQQPEVAGLVAEMQRVAASAGIGCRVSTRSGRDAAEAIVEAAHDADTLVVLGSSSGNARLRALAVVRCSRNPVFIVPAPP